MEEIVLDISPQIDNVLWENDLEWDQVTVSLSGDCTIIIEPLD